MFRKTTILILLFLSLASAQDRIIAIVNKEAITQKDLEDFIRFIRSQISPEELSEKSDKELKKELLYRLIEDRLILQEAQKQNLKVEPARIEAKVRELRKNYNSEKEFQLALVEYGLSLSDIQKKIEEQMLIQKMIDLNVRNKVLVNPSEVSDFYRENKQQFIKPAQYELRVLKIEDNTSAEQIYKELQKGITLEEITKNHSLDPTHITVKKGDELKPEVEKVISNLKENQISPPIKIDNAFYLFKLERIIPEVQEDFESAKERIYNHLYQEKFIQILKQWIEGLKNKSYIKINEENL